MQQPVTWPSGAVALHRLEAAPLDRRPLQPLVAASGIACLAGGQAEASRSGLREGALAGALLAAAGLARRGGRGALRQPIARRDPRCAVRSKGSGAGAEAEGGARRTDDPDYRDLEARLKKLKLQKIRLTCALVGIDPSQKKKGELVDMLLSPSYYSQALNICRPDATVPPRRLLPGVRAELEEQLARSSHNNLSIASLQRLQAAGRRGADHRASSRGRDFQSPETAQPAQEPSSPARGGAEAGASAGPPSELFALWHPEGTAARGGGPRRPLAELAPGERCKGRVVGASLHDGLRVDVGAEADALVSADLGPGSPLAVLLEGVALGMEVEVRLEEVVDPASATVRRFPLVASLLDPALPEPEPSDDEPVPDKVEGGTRWALRLEPGTDSGRLHAARGDGSPAPGAAAAEALAPAEEAAEAALGGAGAAARLGAAAGAPARRAPEKVLSLNADGSLLSVPVPPELRVGEASPPVSEEAAAAWKGLVSEELSLMGLELRCRERLAVDLAEVEVDLATGRVPSIPVAMMGLTPAEDGRRCLAPRPEGDCLRFELREWEDAAQLKEWEKLQEEEHYNNWSGKGKDAKRKREEVLDEFRRFFTCAEACHARAVRAVEAAELQRHATLLAAQHSLDQDLRAELKEGLENSPAVRDNRKLAMLGGWVPKDPEPIADYA